MPTLSQLICQLSPSPTVALNNRAKSLAAAGENVVNLSVGEPDFATPAEIVEEAVKALRQGQTKYGAPGGGMPLRKAVAEKLARDNVLEFSPDEIVCGIGAKEILLHTFMSILNPGDEVLIPAPYWVSYTAHCEAFGAVPIVIPMHEDNGHVTLKPEHIAPFVTPRTKALVLNSPNNPGGHMYGENVLRELGAYLEAKDWWVISDEIYEYLAYEEPHFSILQTNPKLRDRTVIINGLSKGFAMTGWRVGYAAGPKKVMELVRNLQSQSSTSLPGFIEPAAALALKKGPGLLADGINAFKERRRLVTEMLSAIPNVSFIKPQGAFYFFINVEKALGHTDTLSFSERLLVEKKVAMVPGEAFGVPGYLRMSYASEAGELIKGVNGLKELLSES